MATGKKSFILYSDLIHTVRKMPQEKAGILLLTILEYVNDENPKVEDMVVDLVFEPIKQQMKRDLKAWKEGIETKSIGGRVGNLKRWAPDLYERFRTKELTLELCESIAKSRIESHSDKENRTPIKEVASVAVNDNVNVTVNDTVTVINTKEESKGDKSPTLEKRKLDFGNSLIPFTKEYGNEMVRHFFNYWTECNDKGKKMRFEMQKVFDTKKRLNTWKQNEKKFNTGGGASKTSRVEQIANVVVNATDNLINKFSNE